MVSTGHSQRDDVKVVPVPRITTHLQEDVGLSRVVKFAVCAVVRHQMGSLTCRLTTRVLCCGEKGERVDQSEQTRNTVKTKMVDYSLTGLSSECLFHAKFQIHCRSSDLQTANSSSLSELSICLSQVKVHSLALSKSQNSHSYNYRRINVLLHSKRN